MYKYITWYSICKEWSPQTHNRYNGIGPGSLYIMNRVPYVTDVQVQPHGSLYIMKRTLTRIRYKGVPPGSLYIMSRVTNVIYIQEWPLVCILNIVPYVTDIQV